jgi:hypothetical protein
VILRTAVWYTRGVRGKGRLEFLFANLPAPTTNLPQNRSLMAEWGAPGVLQLYHRAGFDSIRPSEWI